LISGKQIIIRKEYTLGRIVVEAVGWDNNSEIESKVRKGLGLDAAMKAEDNSTEHESIATLWKYLSSPDKKIRQNAIVALMENYDPMLRRNGIRYYYLGKYIAEKIVKVPFRITLDDFIQEARLGELEFLNEKSILSLDSFRTAVFRKPELHCERVLAEYLGLRIGQADSLKKQIDSEIKDSKKISTAALWVPDELLETLFIGNNRIEAERTHEIDKQYLILEDESKRLLFIDKLSIALNNVLDTINEREKLILSLHYGLFDGENWTQDEIADELRLTRERVKKIQDKGLRKLRHPVRLNIFWEQLEELNLDAPLNLSISPDGIDYDRILPRGIKYVTEYEPKNDKPMLKLLDDSTVLSQDDRKILPYVLQGLSASAIEGKVKGFGLREIENRQQHIVGQLRFIFTFGVLDQFGSKLQVRDRLIHLLLENPDIADEAMQSQEKAEKTILFVGNSDSRFEDFMNDNEDSIKFSFKYPKTMGEINKESENADFIIIPPNFNGLNFEKVLKQLLKTKPNIPVILLAKDVNEEIMAKLKLKYANLKDIKREYRYLKFSIIDLIKSKKPKIPVKKKIARRTPQVQESTQEELVAKGQEYFSDLVNEWSINVPLKIDYSKIFTKILIERPWGLVPYIANAFGRDKNGIKFKLNPNPKLTINYFNFANEYTFSDFYHFPKIEYAVKNGIIIKIDQQTTITISRIDQKTLKIYLQCSEGVNRQEIYDKVLEALNDYLKQYNSAMNVENKYKLSQFWIGNIDEIDITGVMGSNAKSGVFSPNFEFEGKYEYRPGRIAIGVGDLKPGEILIMKRDRIGNIERIIFERRSGEKIIKTAAWIKQIGIWQYKGNDLMSQFWLGIKDEIDITNQIGRKALDGKFNLSFRFEGNGFKPGSKYYGGPIGIYPGLLSDKIILRRDRTYNQEHVIFERIRNGQLISSAVWIKTNEIKDSHYIWKNQKKQSLIGYSNDGGIDLNPAQMSMQVKKGDQDFKFDFNGTVIDAAQVAGAKFNIETIEPVKNLPAILGFPLHTS